MQEKKAGTAGGDEQAADVEGVSAPSSAAAAGEAGAWSNIVILDLGLVTQLLYRAMPALKKVYLCTPPYAELQ